MSDIGKLHKGIMFKILTLIFLLFPLYSYAETRTSTSRITTSAGLAAALSDETGTGLAVFSDSPTFTGTPVMPALTINSSSGIKSSSGGQLNLGGTGGTDNEILLIDFETYSNKIWLDSISGATEIMSDLDFRVDDDAAIALGNAVIGTDSDAAFVWETTGNDNLQLGLICGAAADSGYFSIMEKADLSNANRSPLATSANPVLRIYSADATSATDYGEFYQDGTNFVCNLGEGVFNTILDTANTATTTELHRLTATSTGTVAASFGASIDTYLEDAAGNAAQQASSIATIWTDATDASEDSAITFSGVSAGGALTEWSRMNGIGLGINKTPAVTFDIKTTSSASTREKLAEFQVSDDSTSLFAIANGTAADSAFIPQFVGIRNASTAGSLQFVGKVTSANDTGSQAILQFYAQRYSGDYMNGTLTAVTTRPILAFQNHGTILTTLEANGDFLINSVDDDGTPATGKFVVKGSTNNGSTNCFVLRDSDELNLLTIDTDGNYTIVGKSIYTPSGAQNITAVGNTILANGTIIVINPDADYTLTSAPTISDGTTGQILYITCANGEANTVTVQDQDSLASSNLQLGAASRAISGKDVLCLLFDGTDWIEVSFANN